MRGRLVLVIALALLLLGILTLIEVTIYMVHSWYF